MKTRRARTAFSPFHSARFVSAGKVLRRAIHAEAARRNQNHVGIFGGQLFEFHPRRMLARFAEKIYSARHLDQRRHPVSRRHQRIDPFDGGDARPLRRAARLVRNFAESRAQPLDQFGSACMCVERIRHALHVGENVVEAVGRERNDLRPRAEPFGDRGFDVALADRAHFALGLRDDHVGTKFAQSGRIDAIDRERIADDLFHSLVDLSAGAFGIEFRFRQRGDAHDRAREIAFVRASDQLIFETKRANDLGRARQKGYDSWRLHSLLDSLPVA